jgi:hypothetical protein
VTSLADEPEPSAKSPRRKSRHAEPFYRVEAADVVKPARVLGPRAGHAWVGLSLLELECPDSLQLTGPLASALNKGE